MANKYLTKDEIYKLIGEIKLAPDFRLMSQDSYNESLIGQAIDSTGKKIELLHAAINIACVGIGNQKYGSYYANSKAVDIADLLSSCGVKLRLPPSTLLKDDDLTVHRLCRFFRYHIYEFLEQSGFETYIYRKYSNHDPKMNSILFRGAEYLEGLTQEQINYQLDTLNVMDAQLGTTLVDRVVRIRQAQGLLKRTVKAVK